MTRFLWLDAARGTRPSHRWSPSCVPSSTAVELAGFFLKPLAFSSSLAIFLNVTPAEALETAHRAGATGQFFVSIHARERQGERTAHRADIREALRTTTKAKLQENERWRLDGGTDLDGDDLTLIVVFEAGVIVVTVF
jgi:hypothetical protein